MRIETLAALKRLPVGTKIVLVGYRLKTKDITKPDWPELTEQSHRAKGIVRTIDRMQTNGLRFSPIEQEAHSWPAPTNCSKGSWLYFPRAEFFEPTDKGFRLLPDKAWDAEMTYEVVE